MGRKPLVACRQQASDVAAILRVPGKRGPDYLHRGPIQMPGENVSRIDRIQDTVADGKRFPQDLDRLLRLIFRGKFDVETPVVVHRDS